MQALLATCVALLALVQQVVAHTVITYPGWRGDNLHANGSVADTDGLQPGGPDGNLWPYGMQWTYPCGGMPVSTNRTKWPIRGGAIAFQPGWFQGHISAQIYINMGFGTNPPNMSFPMLNGIELVGPTNEPWPGTYCFPQVPLPVNATVRPGDNATIQLIEIARHGAALYNCVDITFADPNEEEIPEVTPENCLNSSQISYNLVFTTESLSLAPSVRSSSITTVAVMLALVTGLMFA